MDYINIGRANMDRMPDEIAELFHKAEELIISDDSAQQVIAVQTTQANCYTLANHNIMDGDWTEEESFVNGLVEKEDTEIVHLICIWDTHELDIPSQHLRSLLEEINPQNQETSVWLRGKGIYSVKKLKNLHPLIQ